MPDNNAVMLPEFLNVDLELESHTSLDLLAQEFGDKVHVLHNGPIQDIPYLLAVEIYEGDDADPDSIIGAFCDLLEDLSPKAKAIWKKPTCAVLISASKAVLAKPRNSARFA